MDDNSLSPTIGGPNVPSYRHPVNSANDKNVIVPGNIYQMKGRCQPWHDNYSSDMEACWRIYDRRGFAEAIGDHIEYHSIDKSAEYLAGQISDIYGWRDQVYYALPTEMLSSWSFMVYNMYGESINASGSTSPWNLRNLITGPEF